MHTYRLVYEEDRFGAAKWIEFEARDAGGALKIAKNEAHGRWAQLFENGHFICRLERPNQDDANIWIIAHSSQEPLGELARSTPSMEPATVSVVHEVAVDEIVGRDR